MVTVKPRKKVRVVDPKRFRMDLSQSGTQALRANVKFPPRMYRRRRR